MDISQISLANFQLVKMSLFYLCIFYLSFTSFACSLSLPFIGIVFEISVLIWLSYQIIPAFAWFNTDPFRFTVKGNISVRKQLVSLISHPVITENFPLEYSLRISLFFSNCCFLFSVIALSLIWSQNKGKNAKHTTDRYWLRKLLEKRP